MTQERKIFQPLTSASICEIYNLLFEEKIVSFPLNKDSLKKVDAIVANINGSSFGESHYPSTEEKVAAYLYFLIKDHPFIDGNKRTAILIFRVLCRRNELQQYLENYDLDALAVFIESIPADDYKLAIKVIADTVLLRKSS